MGKKGDLSNFERGMVVGARRVGLSISQSAQLLGFSCTTISRVYKEWCEKGKTSSMCQSCGQKCLVDARGQRRMGRLIQADRRATLTEITTRYNRGMQQSICEATTRTTLRRMGYNSRRPHRVPLISTTNRKKRLQFARAHQNWTVADWKNVAWSDESRFLLRHSNGRVRIWRKQNENMDPSCLVTTVHVHPFMTTMYPSSDGYFQQDNAPCHKARIISNWFLEHDNEFTVLKWPPQSPDLNPIEHLWDVMERELRALDVHPTNLHQLQDSILSIWANISKECFQHLVESMPRRIKAVLKAKGGQTLN
ncbi:TCB1 transposase, partial [Polypterus senegalus]